VISSSFSYIISFFLFFSLSSFFFFLFYWCQDFHWLRDLVFLHRLFHLACIFFIILLHWFSSELSQPWYIFDYLLSLRHFTAFHFLFEIAFIFISSFSLLLHSFESSFHCQVFFIAFLFSSAIFSEEGMLFTASVTFFFSIISHFSASIAFLPFLFYYFPLSLPLFLRLFHRDISHDRDTFTFLHILFLRDISFRLAGYIALIISLASSDLTFFLHSFSLSFSFSFLLLRDIFFEGYFPSFSAS